MTTRVGLAGTRNRGLPFQPSPLNYGIPNMGYSCCCPLRKPLKSTRHWFVAVAYLRVNGRNCCAFYCFGNKCGFIEIFSFPGLLWAKLAPREIFFLCIAAAFVFRQISKHENTNNMQQNFLMQFSAVFQGAN